MRKIQIQLTDGPLNPGDVVEGHVLVTCDDEFECNRLFISLHGQEVARVVIHTGKVTIVHEEKSDHINQQIDLVVDFTIPMGESLYDFSFTLPSNIPGSYIGSYGNIKYTLNAKAEISWARDLKSKKDIKVRFPSNMPIDIEMKSESDFYEEGTSSPLRFESTNNQFQLGQDVSFRFMVDSESNIRGVRTEMIGVEFVQPKGHKMHSKRTLAEVYYPDSEIHRDSWIEVKIPTSENWTESFSSKHIKYTHMIKVTLDVPRRLDKNIEIPIILSRHIENQPSEFDF